MKQRFAPFLVVIAALAGCNPTEPKPVATIDGRELKSATCTNSIVTPTLNMCRAALLKKCRPGASVISVGTQSRMVYQAPNWNRQYIWTVLLKDC